mgnify:CR=1 FL=1
MNCKGHIVIGMAAAVALFPVIDIPIRMSTLALAAIGSLIPDLDHPSSVLNQKILPINNKKTKKLVYGLIGSFVVVLNYIHYQMVALYILGIIIFLIGRSKHRGFTHSALGLFLFMLTIKLLTNDYGFIYEGWSFITGYFSHLFIDFFTEAGIAIFYPIESDHYGAPFRFKTGSVAEKIICVLAMSVIGYKIWIMVS